MFILETTKYSQLTCRRSESSKILNHNGCQSAILNLASSGIDDKIRHTEKKLLQSKKAVSISIPLKLWAKSWKSQTKVVHFKSDIICNITTWFLIPPNPSFETKTESLSLSVLEFWAKMLKMPNKMATSRPFFNLTSLEVVLATPITQSWN